MKSIIALATCVYAHEGKPWMAQVRLKKGETYVIDPNPETPNSVTSAIAGKAVKHENAEYTEGVVENNEDFDPRAASYEEMIAFVESDEDMQELIDVNLEEDDLRAQLIELLTEESE